MPAPPSLLLRQFLLHHRLRFFHNNHHQRFTVAAPHRLWCSAATRGTNSPSLEHANDDGEWKDKEEEILREIEAVVMLTKDILHSPRYMDGEPLTVEDEKIVVEKILAYHPHSEDKTGCV